MKPFIRIKKLHGQDYAYEVTPYYDKEKKQIRQRSKYLGKYEDGKIKRMRVTLPRSAYDYGEFLPLLKICKEVHIEPTLKILLPENMANTILTLSLNKVVNPVGMCNIKTWFERTYLSKEWHGLPLSSQSLSDFLARIGESSIPMEFSDYFIKNLKANDKTLLYDITSLSSASKFIEMLELGYNRDNDSLPQINLSIVAHRKLGIPLFYDIYPGSVVDVTTLKNTIQKLRAYNFQKPTLILDRGFFSFENINELCTEDCDFILPASFASKEVKALVSQVHKNRENPDYLKKYNDDIIFVMPIKLPLKNRSVDGYPCKSKKSVTMN